MTFFKNVKLSQFTQSPTSLLTQTKSAKVDKKNVVATNSEKKFMVNTESVHPNSSEDNSVTACFDGNGQNTSSNVSNAMSEIEKGFNELEDKAAQKTKDGILAFDNNQYDRQEIVVNALCELSTAELEELIEAMGEREFASTILSTLCWQPAEEGDEYKGKYEALRNKIENEIDAKITTTLYDLNSDYKRLVDIAKSKGEGFAWWL